MVCAGVIGTVNVTIGPFAMVNLACAIAHETRVGAYAVVNPTANISGGVELGEEVFDWDRGTDSAVCSRWRTSDGWRGLRGHAGCGCRRSG